MRWGRIYFFPHPFDIVLDENTVETIKKLLGVFLFLRYQILIQHQIAHELVTQLIQKCGLIGEEKLIVFIKVLIEHENGLNVLEINFIELIFFER